MCWPDQPRSCIKNYKGVLEARPGCGLITLVQYEDFLFVYNGGVLRKVPIGNTAGREAGYAPIANTLFTHATARFP
jgi:hypothetical protein